MRKRTLNSFILLALGLCSCSDLGEDVRFMVVKVGQQQIIVQITAVSIQLYNDTGLTVYYESYPAGCDACGNGGLCLNPDTCSHIDPGKTALFEYREGGTIIRWWHLVANDTGYTYDELRYIYITP